MNEDTQNFAERTGRNPKMDSFLNIEKVNEEFFLHSWSISQH